MCEELKNTGVDVCCMQEAKMEKQMSLFCEYLRTKVSTVVVRK